MLTFDPETAYLHAWRYYPLAKAAILRIQSPAGVVDPPYWRGKAYRRSESSTDWQEMGGGSLLIDGNVSVFDWWADSSRAPLPQLDDTLEYDGELYVIRGFPDGGGFGGTSRFACVKARAS